MKIYDAINNPIENDDFLQSIISLYNNGKIKSERDLYGELIFEDNKKEQQQDYDRKFRKYILKRTICTLLKNIGYSIDEVDQIWKECCESDKNASLKHEVLEKLYEKRLLLMGFYDRRDSLENIIAENIFSSVSSGAMGYHVNGLSLGSEEKFKYNNDVKLYINAGADTYEFAAKFEEECQRQNIKYYYKVVRPPCSKYYEDGSKYYEDEWYRKDKLCIYSSKEDLPKFLEIIQQIGRTNPNFDYRNPPEITGTIDSWIGIGVDPKEDPNEPESERYSYSSSRCKIIFEALEELKRNNATIDIASLREKIKRIQIGRFQISNSHFGLSKEMEQFLKKVERPLLRKPKLSVSSFPKFSKLKKLYNNYNLGYDTDTKEICLISKKDGTIIRDETLATELYFIKVWCLASKKAKEDNPFDMKHKKCYEALMNAYAQIYNYKFKGVEPDHFPEECNPEFEKIFFNYELNDTTFNCKNSRDLIWKFIMSETSKVKTNEITTGVIKRGITLSKIKALKERFMSMFKSGKSEPENNKSR